MDAPRHYVVTAWDSESRQVEWVTRAWDARDAAQQWDLKRQRVKHIPDPASIATPTCGPAHTVCPFEPEPQLGDQRIELTLPLHKSTDGQRLVKNVCDLLTRECELSTRVEALELALVRVKRGSCWCEVAVGNPMAREHSKGCQLATEVLSRSNGAYDKS